MQGSFGRADAPVLASYVFGHGLSVWGHPGRYHGQRQWDGPEANKSKDGFVHPDQTSEECMVLMTENRLRHLPVMDGNKLLGLISIGDLVKSIITERKFAIEQLEHYISGERG